MTPRPSDKAGSARTAWLAEISPAGATTRDDAPQTPRSQTSQRLRHPATARPTSAASTCWPLLRKHRGRKRRNVSAILRHLDLPVLRPPLALYPPTAATQDPFPDRP